MKIKVIRTKDKDNYKYSIYHGFNAFSNYICNIVTLKNFILPYTFNPFKTVWIKDCDNLSEEEFGQWLTQYFSDETELKLPNGAYHSYDANMNDKKPEIVLFECKWFKVFHDLTKLHF